MEFKTEKPVHLLAIDTNAKTVKGRSQGYYTGILYLSPADLSGTNVCPAAEKAGCKEACLNTAGRGVYSKVQASRLRKTKLYFEDRHWFMGQLHRDVERLQRTCQRDGYLPAVRLNGTSDIDWQRVPYQAGGVTYRNIFQAFPSVQFYDYTKYTMKTKESNYHLTFSYSGTAAYATTATKALKTDLSLSVVFRGDPPKFYLGRKVVDGDKHDLRFLDPSKSIIALKPKGRAKKDTSGFVVDLIPAEQVA